MGTVIILPELGQATAAWQDLVVGHRQKQVVDYEPLLEGAPEFEELSAQITALVRGRTAGHLGGQWLWGIGGSAGSR